MFRQNTFPTVFMLAIALLAWTGDFMPSSNHQAIGQGKEPTKIQECLQKALEAAREIKERPAKNHLLMEIGLAQAASGDVAGPRNIVKEIDNAEEVAAVLMALASAQAKSGDVSGAKATLKEAEQKALELAKDRTQELLLHGIIEIHAQIGQYAEATRIAALFPDQIDWAQAHVSLIRAQLAAGWRDGAKATLTNLTAKFRRTSDVFDMDVWENICSLYLQLDDVAGALELARAIPKERFERSRVLESVAMHQSKAGNAKEAKAIFAEAFQAARKINDTASDRECQIISVQIQAGYFAEAIKAIDLMVDDASKVAAMMALASAQAKAGNQAAARKTLEAAIQMAEQKLDGYIKTSALSEIAECQAEIHEKEAAIATAAKALQAARKIDMPGSDRAFSFGSVATVQAKIGDRPSAEKTFEEAVRHAGAFYDMKIRAEEAREIAKAQIAVGFTDGARATLGKILLPILPQMDQDPYDQEKVVLLLAQAGDYDNGYALARKFEEYDYRISALLTVAAYHAIAKGSDEPMDFAEKEPDPLVRSAVYLGTALGLLKAKDIEVRNHYGSTLIEEE